MPSHNGIEWWMNLNTSSRVERGFEFVTQARLCGLCWNLYRSRCFSNDNKPKMKKNFCLPRILIVASPAIEPLVNLHHRVNCV
ncbi:hypothetical protein PSHT_03487 [Puccinia striiformis]|uniref:Uncharacterized protein n=1 Tax=Puccinia striiformis TaxID=27350 RepID=A0A2S4WFF7_9BASI|nr:hypothetical protein PSHT_03487 [Puccinia striiformis]